MQEWAESGVEAGGEGREGLARASSSLPLPVIVMPLKWLQRWVTEGEGNYFCVTDADVEKHCLSPSGVGCRPQALFSNAEKKKNKKARIWNGNLIESQDGWLGRFIWVKTHPMGAGNRKIEQEQSCDESCPEEMRVPWLHTGSPLRYWGFGSRTPH